jgi:hypothetical protein
MSLDLNNNIIIKSIDITKYFIFLVLTNREVRLPTFLKVTDYGPLFNFANLDELIYLASIRLAEKLSNIEIVYKISIYEEHIDYLILELFICFPLRILNKGSDTVVILIMEHIRNLICK